LSYKQIEGNWQGVKSKTNIRHKTKKYINRYLVRLMLKRILDNDLFTNIK